MASWDERSRRLELFERLAAERLNPTRFDLVHLEQIRYYRRQATRGAAELAAAGLDVTVGVTLGEVDRHRFFQCPATIGLKTLVGLAVRVPGTGPLPALGQDAAPTGVVTSRRRGDSVRLSRGVAAERRRRRVSSRPGCVFPNDHYRLAYHYYLNRKHGRCALSSASRRKSGRASRRAIVWWKNCHSSCRKRSFSVE